MSDDSAARPRITHLHALGHVLHASRENELSGLFRRQLCVRLGEMCCGLGRVALRALRRCNEGGRRQVPPYATPCWASARTQTGRTSTWTSCLPYQRGGGGRGRRVVHDEPRRATSAPRVFAGLGMGGARRATRQSRAAPRALRVAPRQPREGFVPVRAKEVQVCSPTERSLDISTPLPRSSR